MGHHLVVERRLVELQETRLSTLTFSTAAGLTLTHDDRLVGGLEHVLFSKIYGIILPIIH